jgi:hypothetical protein
MWGEEALPLCLVLWCGNPGKWKWMSCALTGIITETAKKKKKTEPVMRGVKGTWKLADIRSAYGYACSTSNLQTEITPPYHTRNRQIIPSDIARKKILGR